MKTLIKRYLLPFIAIRPLQPFFHLLHRIALVGMNQGPVGEIATSGETKLIRRLMKLASPNDIIMDVGANLGEFSILCARTMPVSGHIFAFEPAPRIHKKLIQNIGNANLQSLITPIPQGLSDHTGKAEIFVTEGYEGNSSIHSRHISHLTCAAEKEIIVLNTLDRFCQERSFDKIFFLKLDIEGEEFAALRGAAGLLSKRQIDYVQFEFGGCNIQSRVFLKDFWDLLSTDYELFRILQNSLFPIISYHELDEIFTTTNYLAIRRGLSKP